MLGRTDLKGVPLKDLIDALEPESVVDRMRVRRAVSVVGKPTSRPFCKIHQSEFHRQLALNDAAPVAFKSRRYAVSKYSGEVNLIVVKRCLGDYTFKEIDC